MVAIAGLHMSTASAARRKSRSLLIGTEIKWIPEFVNRCLNNKVNFLGIQILNSLTYFFWKRKFVYLTVCIQRYLHVILSGVVLCVPYLKAWKYLLACKSIDQIQRHTKQGCILTSKKDIFQRIYTIKFMES